MLSNLEQASRNRSELAVIKRKYRTGQISRNQAKALAQPIIERINSLTVIKTAELNRKYGLNRRPALLDFINAMRNEY